MKPLKSIAVFSGSNNGFHSEYTDAARQLGRVLAQRGLRMIYGGSSKGLMGIAATAALEAGGEVIGIMNDAFFKRGHLQRNLTSHTIVKDMSTRKKLMLELSDGFIALPGGIGTYEEIFEVASLTQIGAHDKNIGLLNTRNYYSHFNETIKNAVREGFLTPDHGKIVIIEDSAETLIEKISSTSIIQTDKWIHS